MIIVLLYSMLMLEPEDVGWSLGTHTVIQRFSNTGRFPKPI